MIHVSMPFHNSPQVARERAKIKSNIANRSVSIAQQLAMEEETHQKALAAKEKERKVWLILKTSKPSGIQLHAVLYQFKCRLITLRLAVAVMRSCIPMKAYTYIMFLWMVIPGPGTLIVSLCGIISRTRLLALEWL